MNTPDELGRNYAAATYTVLKDTAFITIRACGDGHRPEQPIAANSELRRELDAAHERAKAAAIRARQHAQTIADLPAGSQADALQAMYTQFDRTLRADLAYTIRRYRDRFPGCDHCCDEDRPYGLSIDADIQPTSAQGIRNLHAWLQQQKPKYIGGHLEFSLSGGAWTLTSIAVELDENPPPHAVAAISANGLRHCVAEGIVYLGNTLVELDGCEVIATYDGTQAAKALKGFRAKIEKEFEEHLHDVGRRLATGPLEPCDCLTCDTRQKDPWS